MEYNFEKNTEHETLTAYDFDSIMHYGAYAFTANGKKTIVAIKDPTTTIGQRDGLSNKDIAELNALYDCQSKHGLYHFHYLKSVCFYLFFGGFCIHLLNNHASKTPNNALDLCLLLIIIVHK